MQKIIKTKYLAYSHFYKV